MPTHFLSRTHTRMVGLGIAYIQHCHVFGHGGESLIPFHLLLPSSLLFFVLFVLHFLLLSLFPTVYGECEGKRLIWSEGSTMHAQHPRGYSAGIKQRLQGVEGVRRYETRYVLHGGRGGGRETETDREIEHQSLVRNKASPSKHREGKLAFLPQKKFDLRALIGFPRISSCCEQQAVLFFHK